MLIRNLTLSLMEAISMTFAEPAVYAYDGKGRNVVLGPAGTAAGGKKR